MKLLIEGDNKNLDSEDIQRAIVSSVRNSRAPSRLRMSRNTSVMSKNSVMSRNNSSFMSKNSCSISRTDGENGILLPKDRNNLRNLPNFFHQKHGSNVSNSSAPAVVPAAGCSSPSSQQQTRFPSKIRVSSLKDNRPRTPPVLIGCQILNMFSIFCALACMFVPFSR